MAPSENNEDDELAALIAGLNREGQDDPSVANAQPPPSPNSGRPWGCFAIIVGIIAAFAWLFHHNRVQSEANTQAYKAQVAQEQAACLVSPNCQDETALSASYDSSEPIVSATGNTFFLGEACGTDCSAYVAGFKWAEAESAEEPWECGGDSVSFRKGCQLYLEQQRDLSEECLDYFDRSSDEFYDDGGDP